MLRWISLLLLSLVSLARAQSRVECNAISSRILEKPVRYCVLLPPNYDAEKQAGRKYPILYFLHGLGDSEQSLVNLGVSGLINDLRDQHKIGDFLIATPDAKRTFYINSADGRTRYSDFFLTEFMPYIERHYQVRAEAKARGIGGISMGGYGALRFALAHPELFSSVSAQSPALMTDTPAQLNAAMRSGFGVGKLLGDVYGNPIIPTHWNGNSPFLLARANAPRVRKLAIYFNCGDEDDYGFERGTNALDLQLTKQRIKHEYHLYRGRHDVNYFVSHLNEQMEFHSRAFAAN